MELCDNRMQVTKGRDGLGWTCLPNVQVYLINHPMIKSCLGFVWLLSGSRQQ